jgi:transposase-like protein
MAKTRYTAEEIIHLLREVDVLLGQGKSIAEASKAIGVTDHTYFRWRKQFGGLKVDQAKRLKELELENARLKRVVAELAVDKVILDQLALFGPGGRSVHAAGDASVVRVMGRVSMIVSGAGGR